MSMGNARLKGSNNKAIRTAISSLEEERRRLTDRKAQVEAELFKVERIIEQMRDTKALQRIRHQRYHTVCKGCGDGISSLRAGVEFCKKCRVERYKQGNGVEAAKEAAKNVLAGRLKNLEKARAAKLAKKAGKKAGKALAAAHASRVETES